MLYRPLGQTGIEVSLICLGTMTYGEQNSEEQAHAQLDYALERGVNFIDTAELYPVPPGPETQGRTEQYIGSWLAARGNRDRLVLATKAAGPGELGGHIRGGPRLNADHLQRALEASLKRLRTDYVDLYQLHWPERKTNFFGRLGYAPDSEEDDGVGLLETLQALDEMVAAGKIRHIGLSNDTAWGAMKCLQLAERHNLPRIVSIQNPYNLLNRSYEIGLAEVSHREHAGLLAYSPLAFGALSGKYRHGARPEGARLTLWERFSRYTNPQGLRAIDAYVELAERTGLDPAQMALAFVNARPFLTASIIGATTLEQLKANIDSIDLALPPEVLEAIEEIHTECPNPCP